MKYLPYENITYRTQLPGYEVIKRLSENLEPREFFSIGFNRDRKPYEGNIEHNGFSINRVSTFRRNSFNPIIKGELHEDDTGTTIKVKMRLHTLVGIFMIIWCGILSLSLISTVIMGLASKTLEPMFLIIPLIMLLLGYGMAIGFFKYESIRAKKHLAKLFEAEIETP